MIFLCDSYFFFFWDLLRILSKKGQKSLGRSPLQELEEGTRSGEARGCQEDRQPDLSLVPGTPGHLQQPRLPDQVSCLPGVHKTAGYLYDAPEIQVRRLS